MVQTYQVKQFCPSQHYIPVFDGIGFPLATVFALEKVQHPLDKMTQRLFKIVSLTLSQESVRIVPVIWR